ncbi:MAG: J domain-containing protein [Candidatus Nitrosotenuis sp.]
MNHKDAFNILGITAGHTTSEAIKAAYRKAAQQYHPDRNSAGLEMMKLINAAYDIIKDFNGNVDQEGNNKDYGNHLNAALNAIIGLGLNIEICGAWIWVSGNTKSHKETLKSAGYRWAPKKALWYFRPDDYKCRKHKAWRMEDIYSKYGRDVINTKQAALQATS